MVIGTCVERLSRAKRVAWRYLRALTGLGLADFTSGLRLYDARAVDILAGPAASLLDYQDVGVLMLLAKNGLTIEETPVPMLERREESVQFGERSALSRLPLPDHASSAGVYDVAQAKRMPL